MTLYQKNLAEVNSTKLLLLVTELCDAIDKEHIEKSVRSGETSAGSVQAL
jgi:hypothetical protein